jgi:uncharacterized protein (TIGR03437 family)
MKLLLLLLAALPNLMAGDAARDARWRQDLDTIATRLPALHPNLFFQTPRRVFEQAVTDLAAAIPDLNDAEVMTGLARIAALIGDGHTNLMLTQRASTFRMLPVAMRWFEDGLFVTAAGPAYSRALAARVVRIGDRSVEDAYDAVGAIISHENDSWVREFSPNYLANADVLQALKIAPDNRSVRFELQELSGERFELDVASLEPGQSVKLAAAPDPASGPNPLWRQHTDQYYWFTYLESSRTLYFAYNQCADQGSTPFAQFNTQLWAVFDEKPVERFVIDLRNNSGGNSQILATFIEAGGARAGRFFSAVKPVAIIGRRTFSSAIINAIQLRQGGVQLYGEASGGSPNSYGEVKQLVLPNSQLIVSYSTRYFSWPGYGAGPLAPDVPVKIYSADYFARHDPFVAAVLAGETDHPETTAGGATLVNAAHFRPSRAVAPGSIAAVFGDFGIASGVVIDGLPAMVFAAAPGQINVRVPDAVKPGAAAFQVLRDGAQVASGSAAVENVAPGLFVIDALDPARPGAIIAAGDAAIVRGSVIQIFGTGQGAADPPPATRVYIGGEAAEVLFSGAQPVFPGLWQINARVPDREALSGEVPVYVVVGSSASNAVTIKVTGR